MGNDTSYLLKENLQYVKYNLHLIFNRWFTWHTVYKALSFAVYMFRFEAPFAPNVEVMKHCVVDTFPIAIVGFAVAFSVAKVYSVKHDYVIDGNQVRN